MRKLLLIILVAVFCAGCVSICQAQEGKKEKKKGKLGKLAKTYTDDEKDEDGKKKKSDNDDDDSFFAVIVEDMLSYAISNMQAGPYPYNGAAANFSPTDVYPGGILHVQSSYFRHNSDLFGLLWRINYYYKRFGIDFDLINLIEDLGMENDYLNLAGWRVSWDFVADQEFRFGGQLGLRNLSYEGVSKTGPDAGFRLVGLPAKPFIFEGTGTVARINGHQLSTLSGTFGVMVKRVHIFLGGEIIRSSDISIDGFKLGFRVWL